MSEVGNIVPLSTSELPRDLDRCESQFAEFLSSHVMHKLAFNFFLCSPGRFHPLIAKKGQADADDATTSPAMPRIIYEAPTSGFSVPVAINLPRGYIRDVMLTRKYSGLLWKEWRGRRDSNPRPLP